MKYFSLFSGIGGFELGIEKANACSSELQTQSRGWNEDKRTTSKRFGSSTTSKSRKDTTEFCCVGYSEINKYAIRVYQQHFPGHKNYGDATKINTAELPDFDMLCGGFPCQSFSLAGKRQGFQDVRGTLFFEICRIAKEKKPRLLFLENVKGLLSADNGRCFGTIISSLDELGYDVEWQVLNSKNFGVPQNRERVFIIGHLRGTGGQTVFPIGNCSGKNDGTYEKEQGSREGIRMQDCSTALRAHHTRSGCDTLIERTPLKFMNRNQKNIEGDYSFTIDGMNTGGILIKPVQLGQGKDSRAVKSGTEFGNQDESFTVRSSNPNGVMQGAKIRRLTPTECERLQGFPDGWTACLSDAQRYNCIGNAVTVNVIQAIAETMLNHVKEG